MPMDDLWQAEAALIIPPDSAEDLTLHVDVQGFEGPMDLLLHLARNQKVDLTQISVLALAEQYLKFIELARDRKLELAADYLVMAAWLAYLKSRLLIPKVKDEDGETGEQLASVLQFRLKRLEAMRDAAGTLVNRDRLGRDVFARGMPETVLVEKTSLYSGSLYDLLTAYASQRQRQAVSHVQIAKRTVWSLKEARVLLVRMVGELQDWVALDAFLLDYIARPEDRASAIASSFAASLELVREGKMQLRQNAAFEPIFVRAAERKTSETKSDDASSETKDEA
ncbi:segregation and condensation protein A [Pseudochrobactrum kiredjianiae]|uniref:Segregation and condensation protein A n=1 Tax=Pseudochrobactrum kiredjianiae TaxID=386305 RepID=A0ABW3V1B1_9HYPH